MRFHLAVVVPVAALALLGSAGVSASGEGHAPQKLAKRGKKCKRTERRVQANTPVLGGPGLGYEVIHVPAKSACLRVVSTTDDGSFAMVRFVVSSTDDKGKPTETERAGWVATGLVDEDLSDTSEDAPVPAKEGETASVFTIKDTVLRDTPRFDGKVTGEPLVGGTKLAVTARSADGQWLKVKATLGDKSFEGFIAKYQVSATELAEGAAPDAGSGTWSAPRAGRSPYADSPAATKKPVAGTQTPKPVTPPRQKTDGQDAAKKDGGEGPKQAESDPNKNAGMQGMVTDEPDAKPTQTGPLLGRTQEVSVNASYLFWHERYASNAASDPFAQYAVNAMLGGGLALHYMYRGDFPIVAGLGADLAMSGFQVADPNTAQPATLFSLQVGLQPRVGWRFVASPDVDVEAGLLANLDGFVPFGGPANFITSNTGFFYQGGPWLAARARLGGGKYGFFAVDAALLLGGYTMVPFASTTYQDQLTAGTGDPDAVNADGCSAGFTLPDQPVDDPGTADIDESTFDPYAGVRDETCYNHLAAAPPVHLGIGTDVSFRYGYPVLDFLRLDVVMRAKVRNASIRGGGIKNPVVTNDSAYSEASNLDVGLNFGVGATFTF